MNQKNNKKAKNNSEQKEEKDFFVRAEVKTMEKDISQLHEEQAKQERERISKIKTEEEAKKEKEREERAQKASQERGLAEKEAQERGERVKRLKNEREEKEETLEKEKIEKEGIRAGDIKEALKKTQEKEEEERKRFLERVAAKAEGKEEIIPPIPQPLVPPPPPISTLLPEKPPAKPPKPKTPKRPISWKKLGIRIILSLMILAIMAAISTFWYWYFMVRESTLSTQEPERIEKELVIPSSLIPVDATQNIKVSIIDEVPSALSQILEEPMEQGLIKRIVIENQEKNEVLGIKDFFEAFPLVAPEDFYNKVGNNFTLFNFSQEEGQRLGLILKVKEEGLSDILSPWEETMEEDLEELFNLFNKDVPALSSKFKDATFQEIPFRYQTFSRQDLGIVYAVYEDYFILTTSWKSMEKALEKLKETPISFFLSPDIGADFFLNKLTLEERVGQLFLIGIEGTKLTSATERLIRNIRPGGILLLRKNIVNEAQTKKLVQDLQGVSLQNNGIPLLIAVDQEGGEISPVNFTKEKTSPSEIENTTQAYEVGFNRGEELRNLGINLNLAPVLDMAKSEDFIFGRSFQKDEEEISALAKALILGQKEASILTAIKHFPGYGNVNHNPEKELAVLDTMPNVEQFQQAMETEPEMVMVSSIIYSEVNPNLPFALSPEGIQLLKEKLGNDCIIITDDLPQNNLLENFSLKGIITLPIQAGVDILIFSDSSNLVEEAARLLFEAVKNNEISKDRINQSVLKIIKLKQGLL